MDDIQGTRLLRHVDDEEMLRSDALRNRADIMLCRPSAPNTLARVHRVPFHLIADDRDDRFDLGFSSERCQMVWNRTEIRERTPQSLKPCRPRGTGEQIVARMRLGNRMTLTPRDASARNNRSAIPGNSNHAQAANGEERQSRD